MELYLTEKLLSICESSKVDPLIPFSGVYGVNNLTEEQRVQVETELIKQRVFNDKNLNK